MFQWGEIMFCNIMYCLEFFWERSNSWNLVRKIEMNPVSQSNIKKTIKICFWHVFLSKFVFHFSSYIGTLKQKLHDLELPEEDMPHLNVYFILSLCYIKC